jgi:hypothetical protein
MDGAAAMIELVLVFGIVMGISLWQLVSVKREIRRDRERALQEKAAVED